MVEQPTLQAIRATGRDLAARLERLAYVLDSLEARGAEDGRHSLVEARALVRLDQLRAALEKQVLGPLADLASSN